MARIPGRIDGRYIGSTAVSSADAWTDVALDSLDSATGEAIPVGDRVLVDLFVYETSGEAPAYLLLRAHGELANDAFTGALIVPAGTGRPIGAYLPDAPISTIAIHGSARVEAILI